MNRNTAVTTWREVCGSDTVMASFPPTGRMLEDFAARIEAAAREDQGRKIETLLRGITDARCLIAPIWRERMGAEAVREHVQRGMRCIDSAITDCKFLTPNV